MVDRGWSPSGTNDGALCDIRPAENVVSLNIGAMPSATGCFFFLRAPGLASVSGSSTTFQFNKANKSPDLCVWSVSQSSPHNPASYCGRPGEPVPPTLNTAASGDWVMIGIYNNGSPLNIATRGANNVVFPSGTVVISDPYAPTVNASGPAGVQTASSVGIAFSSTDAESHPRYISAAVDGVDVTGNNDDGCDIVWICGPTRSGGLVLSGLDRFADGQHTVTVTGGSVAGPGSTAFVIDTDTHGPSVPTLTAQATAGQAAGWFSKGPVAVSVTDWQSALDDDGVTSSTARVLDPMGKEVWKGAPGANPTTFSVPAAALTQPGTYVLVIQLCDRVGHCVDGKGALKFDPIPPVVTLNSTAWTQAPQTLTVTATDGPLSGVASVTATVDGKDTPLSKDRAFVVDGEGAHQVHIVARDVAGNETLIDRVIGIDRSAPILRGIGFDDAAHALRVDVADGSSGVGAVAASLAGKPVEALLAADHQSALVTLPAGTRLDGAQIHVVISDQTEPANTTESDALAPVRPASVIRDVKRKGAIVMGLAAGPTGVLAGAPVELWAHPRRQAPRIVARVQANAAGHFSVRLPKRLARTTRYAARVGGTDELQPSQTRNLGVVGVRARITRFTLTPQADELVVSAQYSGRGETARVHLFARQLAGGRWAEACELLKGGLGVTLTKRGRIAGRCRIPAAARSREWIYRLEIAEPPETWPWANGAAPLITLGLA